MPGGTAGAAEHSSMMPDASLEVVAPAQPQQK